MMKKTKVRRARDWTALPQDLDRLICQSWLAETDSTVEDKHIADVLDLPPMYAGADSRDSRIMNRLVVARIVAHRARLARGEDFIRRYTHEFMPSQGLG